VIILVNPDVQEARVIREILRIFCFRLGLVTNLAMCSVTPIFRSENVLEEIKVSSTTTGILLRREK